MSLVDIKFNFPILSPEEFKAKEHIIYDAIAATMQTQRAMIFDKEGAYNGRQKWAPLKFRTGQILSDKGTLRKSIGPTTNGMTPVKSKGSIVRFEAETVTIGTDIAYAMIHDQGGVITPINGKFLVFKVPKGKRGSRFIFAKKVTIPARTFSDITGPDTDEIQETMAGLVAGIFNGAN